MVRRRAVARWICIALCVALVAALAPIAAAGDKDKKRKRSKGEDKRAPSTIEIRWEPPSSSMGRFYGDPRFHVGTVAVADPTEAPGLGAVGDAKAVTEFVAVPSQAELVELALRDLLAEVGLADPTGEVPGPVRVDVVIRRNRIFSFPGGLRAEVFLDLALGEEGEPIGRVLACGNAELVTKNVAKKLGEVGMLYRAAFHDALYKWVTSETFSLAAGDRWEAGTAPAMPGDPAVTHIDRSVDYGPSADAVDTAHRLRGRFGPYTSLTIDDFSVADAHYLEQKRGDRATASRAITDRVVAQLVAYYPWAFPAIERRSGWGRESKGLVVTGRVLRYDPGGRNNKLIADVYFKDGPSAVDRFAINVDWSSGTPGPETIEPLSGGAAWAPAPFEKMTIDQLEEALARDLAYVLVSAVLGEYTYPDDFEVRFDDRPYPWLPPDD